MRPTRSVLIVAVFALFVVDARAQSRTDDFQATSVTWTASQLWPLPDGGCQMRACGEVYSADGGTVARDCTDTFELRSGVNQNRCNGLANAAQPRLQRALRFDVDGGAP